MAAIGEGLRFVLGSQVLFGCMLLDLFAAELEGNRVSVSSLCIAAGVAPTTAPAPAAAAPESITPVNPAPTTATSVVGSPSSGGSTGAGGAVAAQSEGGQVTEVFGEAVMIGRMSKDLRACRAEPRPVAGKTPVRVVLGLCVAYLAFAWLAFEPLTKWAAAKIVADKSRHQLSIAEARFDPFALSLTLRGVKLKEPDGKQLLAFDELFVDFDAASLLRWAWSFEAVRLSGPQARVELLPGGRLNWSARR